VSFLFLGQGYPAYSLSATTETHKLLELLLEPLWVGGWVNRTNGSNPPGRFGAWAVRL